MSLPPPPRAPAKSEVKLRLEPKPAAPSLTSPRLWLQTSVPGRWPSWVPPSYADPDPPQPWPTLTPERGPHTLPQPCGAHHGLWSIPSSRRAWSRLAMANWRQSEQKVRAVETGFFPTTAPAPLRQRCTSALPGSPPLGLAPPHAGGPAPTCPTHQPRLCGS